MTGFKGIPWLWQEWCGARERQCLTWLVRSLFVGNNAGLWALLSRVEDGSSFDPNESITC